MPNKNYLRGVKFERDLVNQARTNGHISGRMAGSHSPYDLFIIDKKNMTIMFIQCKTELTVKNKADIVKVQGEGTFNVRFVWMKKFITRRK